MPALETTIPESQLSSARTYPRPHRLEMFDAWRGICCLMLVVFHSSMQAVSVTFWERNEAVTDLGTALLWLGARCWIGVPIFFVISGYCIMATLTSRADRGGVAEFAKRRFIRIYPPYWTALAISAVAIVAIESRHPELLSGGTFTIHHPFELGWDAWIGNLTLTESWRHCVWGSEAKHLLPNTWTLAYEEQFYVVAGLVLVLLPRRVLLGFGLFTVIAMGGKILSKLMGWEVQGSIFDGQWLLIACGLLLYYRLHFATGWQIHAVHGLLAIGMLTHLSNPAQLLDPMPNHDIDRFVAFGFTLITSLTVGREAAVARSKWLAPLRRCGTFSYSIYLSHAVVAKGISHAAFRVGIDSPLETMLLVVPTCVVTSVLVGALFYRGIERHFIPGKSSARTTADQVALPLDSRAGTVA